MKTVKLIAIFICCVVVLVGILYIPRLLHGKGADSASDSVENTAGVENQNEEIKAKSLSIDNENYEAAENSNQVLINDPIADTGESYSPTDQPIPEDEAMARHIAQKKETEHKLLSLLNSGRYEESEQICKTEWSLNTYYVDVKYIRKVLTSKDNSLKESIRRAGIIDSKGVLTEDYKLRSVKGIAPLKKKLEIY